MANFAGKFGLKVGRTRTHLGSGGSFGSSDSDPIGYQPLAEVEMDRKYGPQGSKSRAYYEKLKMTEFNQSRKFSQDMIAQEQKEIKTQFDKEKEFVGKWTDLILKARETGDMALQKHLLSYGRDYIDTLSYGTRQLLEPIIRAGPFDPAKAKLDKYDELNPAPAITADREKQPLAFAEQSFAMADWKAARVHYATGQTPPRINMIPYGDQKDGRFMTRDEKGNASVITEGDLQLKEFAKTFGTTVGEVLANNGTAKGKETTMMIGGKPTKVRSSTDFATRQTSLDYLPGATPEQYAKHEQEIGEFLAVYSSDDNNLIKKNAKVQAVVDMEKAGIPFDQIAEKILKPQYGMNFVKLPKAGFIHNLFTSNDTLTKEGYATSDKVNIAYFPGEKDVLRTPDGGSYPVYYEKSDDSVYSPIGIKLGTPLEAVNKIMAEEEKKRKAKEQEDTFKKIEDEMDKRKYEADKSSLPLETRRPMGYYGGQKFFD